MIAVVSSTLFPSALPTLEGPRSVFSPDERLSQTRNTVSSLVRAGISEIHLCDNSEPAEHARVVAEFAHLQVHTFESYPFRNRGIGELLLLLGAVRHLPAGRPIIKISGRYSLTPDFRIPSLTTDIGVFKGNDFHRKSGQVSTRCFVVRDRAIFEQLLLDALTEIFVAQERVVGPRSLMKALGGIASLRAPREPTTSIEFALANAIKRSGLPVQVVDRIGVEGRIGGLASMHAVSE